MSFPLLAAFAADTAAWIALAALSLALEAAGLAGLHFRGTRIRPLTWIVRGAMHASSLFATALFLFLSWLIFHFFIGGND